MHYKHLNDMRSVKPLVNALLPHKNVSFVWENDNWAPRTSPGKGDDVTIWLPKPGSEWTDDMWDSFWAAVYHEAGHWHPDTIDIWDVLKEEKINCKSITGMTLNCIDDHRADMNHRDEYAGKLEACAAGRKVYFEGLTESKDPTTPVSEERALLEGLLLADLEARDKIDGMSGNIRVAGWDKFNPDSQKVAEKLMNSPDIMSRWHCATASEELQLSKDILEFLGYEDDHAIMEEPEPGPGGGGESGEEGEGEEEGHGEAEGNSDSKEGGKGKGKGKGEAEQEDLSDLVMDNHDVRREYVKEVGKDLSSSEGSLTIDYSTYMSGKYRKCYASEEELAVVDLFDPKSPKLIAGQKIPFALTSSMYSSKGTAVKEALPASATITNRVRKILQIELRRRYLTNQRKGKLNGNSLHKLRTTKSRKPTIFKNKVDKKQDDCRISILVDNSGSMGGSKQYTAIQSSVYLATLCDALRVPYEVTYFTEDSIVLNMITKPFDKPTPSDVVLEHQESKLRGLMGGNSDGDSVRLAYDRLLHFGTEKRKCLFVLSDGQPSSMRITNETGLLRDTIKLIEKDPRVEVMGIGIQDDSVRRYYKNYIILRKVSELEDKLIDLVSRAVLGKALV